MVNVARNAGIWLNPGMGAGALPGEKSVGTTDRATGASPSVGSAAASWRDIRIPLLEAQIPDQTEGKPEMTEDLMDYIRGKMQEIYNKILNGDTEESYAIGGASYTRKEWERLIQEFDAAEEAIQEEIAEELLTAEKVKTERPSSRTGEKGETFFTFFATSGIYCKVEGEDWYEWQIEFDDISQYEKVMSVLSRFNTEESVPFANSKYFWEDVLTDSVDVDDLVDYCSARERDGEAECAIFGEDGSVRIDPESVKYTKYMPPSYVGRMFHSLEALLEYENRAWQKLYEEWEKSPETWVDDFNREHPDRVGLKSFFHYGRGYTAEDLAELWIERKERETREVR